MCRRWKRNKGDSGVLDDTVITGTICRPDPHASREAQEAVPLLTLRTDSDDKTASVQGGLVEGGHDAAVVREMCEGATDR